MKKILLFILIFCINKSYAQEPPTDTTVKKAGMHFYKSAKRAGASVALTLIGGTLLALAPNMKTTEYNVVTQKDEVSKQFVYIFLAAGAVLYIAGIEQGIGALDAYMKAARLLSGEQKVVTPY